MEAAASDEKAHSGVRNEKKGTSMNFDDLVKEYDKDPQSVRDMLAQNKVKASAFDRGVPLLSRALAWQRLDIAADLIGAGADVGAYAKRPAAERGMAPIHFAGSPQAVELLKKAAADIDAPYQLVNRAWGMVGETALHTAALDTRPGGLALAEALARAGADVTLPYSDKEYKYDRDSNVPNDERIVRRGSTIADRMMDLRRAASNEARGTDELLDYGNPERIAQAQAEQAADKDVSGKASAEKENDEREASDAVENMIERGVEAEQQLDEKARDEATQAKRQADTQRRQNMKLEHEEEVAADAAAKKRDVKDEKKEEDEDRAKAVPDTVKRKFIQVEDKYFFPDETPAFEDGGEKLHARAEHKEVVAALVAIAAARDWDQITVKGTEVFRRAVWMEASMRGMEVKGYKPSEIEKARLAKMLAKDGQDKTSSGPVENTVEKGITREAEKSVDQTSHAGESKGEQMSGSALRKFSGELLEHGEAKYQFQKDESMSYFVRLKTDEGEKVVWGKDLKRAMEQSGTQVGERVNVEYMGNVPVKVIGNVRDEETGQVIDKKEIDTHRNTWNVEKVDAFLNKDRAEAVKEHPDLAKAYGAQAAAKKFSESEKVTEKWSPETRERFNEKVKEKLTQDIGDGKPLPNVRVASTRKKEANAEQDRKVPEKSRDAEMTR
jgi:hypothetical protein